MSKGHRRSKARGQAAARSKGGELRPTWQDAVRQHRHPAAFRAELPAMPAPGEGAGPGAPLPPPERPAPPPAQHPPEPRLARALADLATCLWYLQTRYFRRRWGAAEGQEEDPRARRALGRLARGIDALQAAGVVVQDPTDQRYPPGADAYLRPLQFQPTAGVSVEKVTETVTPAVFWGDRLIQRGEVFVAVPLPAAEGGDGGTPAGEAEGKDQE
jgi:hypothetical protein